MSNKTSAEPIDFVDEYSSLVYLINTIINNRINTAELVRVIANNGDGTVDVMPIISDVDNDGNAVVETPVFNVKFFEWQYGINAIKAEPAIGDVGLVVVCTKDTQNAYSGVVGSLGRFELGSGIYIGGIKGLNQVATQTIVMDENGITITTPKSLVVNATEDVTVNAVNVIVNASAKASVVSPAVNLGIEGGKKIALDGDPVKSGNTVVGNIVASSTTTKSG